MTESAQSCVAVGCRLPRPSPRSDGAAAFASEVIPSPTSVVLSAPPQSAGTSFGHSDPATTSAGVPRFRAETAETSDGAPSLRAETAITSAGTSVWRSEMSSETAMSSGNPSKLLPAGVKRKGCDSLPLTPKKRSKLETDQDDNVIDYENDNINNDSNNDSNDDNKLGEGTDISDQSEEGLSAVAPPWFSESDEVVECSDYEDAVENFDENEDDDDEDGVPPLVDNNDVDEDDDDDDGGSAAEAEAERLRLVVARLKAECARLREEKRRIEEEEERRRKERERLAAEIAKAKAEFQRLKAECDRLKRHLAKQEEEIARLRTYLRIAAELKAAATKSEE